MKHFRIIALLLCALLAMGACAAEPASTGSSGSDSASSAVSEPSASVDKAELASLQEKLLEAQSQLSALQEENKKLLERLATLEESEGRPLTKRKLSNGATLTYEPGTPDGPVYSTSLANGLRVVYEDGEVEIGSGLSSVEVSPDGTRLLYNQDFAWESVGTLWLYDFEAREKRQFSLDGLPTGSTPAYADWLDDRYVLYIEQYASGTITVGGELCVYDTETAKSARLTDTVKERFQICSFTVYGQDCIVFRAEQYDEGYGETESSYPVLTVAKLYDVIRSGGTVDLRS